MRLESLLSSQKRSLLGIESRSECVGRVVWVPSPKDRGAGELRHHALGAT